MQIIIGALLLTSSLIFDKDVSGKKSEVSWLVEEKNKLIEILGMANGKKTEISCDLNYHFSKYLSVLEDNHIFTVTRDNDTLLVEATSSSATKQQRYSIASKKWVQDFSFGLRPFFMSDDYDYKFEIVNPKDLVMRTMIATKGEMEFKTFNNVEYRAQKVKITLDGYYKRFWKAELWFDTKTYNLLYYKANEGPSTPYTILTLKQLKQ